MGSGCVMIGMVLREKSLSCEKKKKKKKEMASWEQSFTLAYKNSHSTFVTLPVSPKNDKNSSSTTTRSNNAFAGGENKSESSLRQYDEKQNGLEPSGSALESAKDLCHHEHSSLVLNHCLKLRETTNVSSFDCHSELGKTQEFLEQCKSYTVQQCISKDMLCAVVKGMELTSKNFGMDTFESLESILQDLCEDNIEVRCISILNLAEKCRAAQFHFQLDVADALSLMLKTLPDILSFNDLVFCCAALLCVLTLCPKNRDGEKLLELLLPKWLHNTTGRKKTGDFCMESNDIGRYSIKLLPGNVMEQALELFKQMSVFKDWELQRIDVMFLNCLAVHNIFMHSSEGGHKSGSTEILCWVMDKIHEGSEQLDLGKEVCCAESSNCHSYLRTIWKCLQILEEASFPHPENQKYLPSCQNFAVSRNTNRILVFCLKYLLYDAPSLSLDTYTTENDISCKKDMKFYLKACLVSILKVLLNISHNHKEAVIKLGAINGLMEKLLMCVLSIGFQKSEEQFEMLILCLELLINLIEPCWANRITFAKLCLKRYAGSVDSNMFAVERLIEILAGSLNEIKLLEQLKDEATKEASDSSSAGETVKNPDNMKSDIVIKAAGKHMEQSMICAYISFLLGFFVDIKKTLRDLVCKKISQENIKQAILVSKNFLSFVKLTEGTNHNSIRSLKVTLSALESVHDGC